MKVFLVWAAALLMVPCVWAATTVSGIKFEDSVDFHGQKLVLNGAGVRYKFVVKVYAAGLYLARPARTAEEVYKTPGPKRLTFTMLRDADANEMGKLFIRGVEDNASRANFTKWLPGLLKVGEVFGNLREFRAGDTVEVDWVPGTGATFSVRGKVLSVASTEPEFFEAVMSVWLGRNPADWKLKDALLGVKP